MQRQGAAGKPLVIMDTAGRLLDIASMNRKGFTKSTEQGELWVLHEETARVLPYGGGLALLGVVEEERWYRATVERKQDSPGEAERSAGERESAEPGAREHREGAREAGTVLQELCEVIRERRRERPQGSYTTYLFDAGEEKIRKKTGEEAIELVLARNRSEVVSEAADLVYHMLVLLNQLEIPLDEVIAELARRA